mmetsp:Transcript_38000/g.65160  ORF Transcript_38000/g.65160 Transcript_38000/m.65160 type:complete len:266 (+) Transcript_38000:83-880(+)
MLRTSARHDIIPLRQVPQVRWQTLRPAPRGMDSVDSVAVGSRHGHSPTAALPLTDVVLLENLAGLPQLLLLQCGPVLPHVSKGSPVDDRRDNLLRHRHADEVCDAADRAREVLLHLLIADPEQAVGRDLRPGSPPAAVPRPKVAEVDDPGQEEVVEEMRPVAGVPVEGRVVAVMVVAHRSVLWVSGDHDHFGSLGDAANRGSAFPRSQACHRMRLEDTTRTRTALTPRLGRLIGEHVLAHAVIEFHPGSQPGGTLDEVLLPLCED